MPTEDHTFYDPHLKHDKICIFTCFYMIKYFQNHFFEISKTPIYYYLKRVDNCSKNVSIDKKFLQR